MAPLELRDLSTELLDDGTPVDAEARIATRPS